MRNNLSAVSLSVQDIATQSRYKFNADSEARPHTPVYTMHKYYARRPWNIFSQLVSQHSCSGDIVLDPFCGGGTTVVESLKLRRRAIGVDINPLATHITEMECKSFDAEAFREAFAQVSSKVKHDILSLYDTKCANCGSKAQAHWIEWDELTGRMVRIKYHCPSCRVSRERSPDQNDVDLSREISRGFASRIKRASLWFPRTRIPHGDKTETLLNRKIQRFYELFTRRNLLALSVLLRAIEDVEDENARQYLKFALSGSLKWASRQSHRRGNIVEGWAMHAYWVYPRSLEINVWNVFERRALAVLKGKHYSTNHIGSFCRLAANFTELANGHAHCLILNESSARLPLPDESVDSIITDPPYGSNINYAELSDYWCVWLNKGETIDKEDEIVINNTQHKVRADYERLLHRVFSECYRVLKPQRQLVCTFNSKDLRVVTSFIVAVVAAGFVLRQKGLVYQKPIRAYSTTFHAMQIGAFVGDFIFTFVKEKAGKARPQMAHKELHRLKGDLTMLVSDTVGGGMTEAQLRERAYRILIPYIAKHARVDRAACDEAVDFFEEKIGENSHLFKDQRLSIIETRRRAFDRKR